MIPTSEILEADLRRKAAAMCEFAERAAHYIDTAAGETPAQKYPADLRFVLKEPSWGTSLVFTYCVEVNHPGWPSGHRLRHLSIQLSIRGEVTQGQLQAAREELLAGYLPMVRCFFPLADALGVELFADAPVPVVDPREGKEGNVHMRTPVVAHFIQDMDADAPTAGARHDGVLLDPEGRPLPGTPRPQPPPPTPRRSLEEVLVVDGTVVLGRCSGCGAEIQVPLASIAGAPGYPTPPPADGPAPDNVRPLIHRPGRRPRRR